MLKFCKPKHLYAEQGENIDESVFLVKSRRFTTFFRSFVYLQQKRTCRLGQVGFRDGKSPPVMCFRGGFTQKILFRAKSFKSGHKND